MSKGSYKSWLNLIFTKSGHFSYDESKFIEAVIWNFASGLFIFAGLIHKRVDIDFEQNNWIFRCVDDSMI